MNSLSIAKINFFVETLKFAVEMFLPSSENPLKNTILDGFMLPSKYMLGSSIKILLLFTTAFCPAFRLVFYAIYYLPNCDYTTKESTFDCIHTVLDVIILSLEIMLVLFGLNFDYFRKFISSIESLSVENDSLAIRTIKRNRRLSSLILAISFIGNNILCSIYTFATNTNIGIFEPALLITNEVCITFGFFFLLNMTCNICVFLQAAFNQINSQIAALNGTTKQMFNSFDEIRDLRQKYSYAVRSAQNADKLLRYFVTIFYIEYFSFNIMNIVRFFGPTTKMEPFWLYAMLFQTVQLIILTYNLVSVNNLSRQGLEDLYEFSFKLNSLHLYHENDIFIARMALSDVGFTFANLFTINNSFITSMFTLSLTIIIALASFIYR
uniref:Gustatory receptor n=1 Tax=Tetranychus urticae TaxID=32264 RepID=T1KPA6_TETUR